MKTEIYKVETPLQIQTVAEIAEIVWHETYDPILPEGQTEYMIEQFQSAEAVQKQLDEKGYIYFLLCCDDRDAGFFALVSNEAGSEMMLSKIYLLKEFRGKGGVKKAFDFIKSTAENRKLKRIWLTVNKENIHAQNVYRHFGFDICGKQTADIGQGYVMDDYLMELIL